MNETRIQNPGLTVEAIAEVVCHEYHPNLLKALTKPCQACKIHATRLLASPALATLRAHAWDQGYTSGHSNAMRRMSDEPNAPTTPNPFRDRADRQEPQ